MNDEALHRLLHGGRNLSTFHRSYKLDAVKALEPNEVFTARSLMTNANIPKSKIYGVIKELIKLKCVKKYNGYSKPPPEYYKLWGKARRRSWRRENGWPANSHIPMQYKFVGLKALTNSNE